MSRALNVLFRDSAAGAVLTALTVPGSSPPRIARLPENFELGPIAPTDPRRRSRWFRGWYLPRFVDARTVHRFWRQVVDEEVPTVWACHRDAREWCGFLELLWRRRRPVRLIDVAAVRLRRSYSSTACSTAMVPSEDIANNRLATRARVVSQSEVDALTETWEALAREADALPLRIATSHGLLAVPISHFDEAIVASAPREWTRLIELIATLLSAFTDSGYAPVDVEFLHLRIVMLVAEERGLESDGDLADRFSARVRRAP